MVHFKTEIANILPQETTHFPIRSVCPYGLLELYKALKCEEFKKGFFQRRLDIFCMIILSIKSLRKRIIFYSLLSSLFEKLCSEKCRLYSLLAKFVLNCITAATIYYEEEPGNRISMLKRKIIMQYSETNC